MRTPRTQVARPVPRLWALLRAQQAGRAHAGRALVATRPGSLPSGQVATSFQVATSWKLAPCRDIKLVSQHHSGQSRSRPPGGVATPLLCPHRCPCRDIKLVSRHQAYPSHCHPCRDIQFMSRHQAQSSHFCPCRDILFMSRHQACSAPSLLRRDAKQCRDLALSGPCHAHLAPCLSRPQT